LVANMGAAMQTLNQRRALVQITGPAFSPFRDYAGPAVERAIKPGPMAESVKSIRRRQLLRFGFALVAIAGFIAASLATTH
jgi:hypothetical protein